MRDRIVLRVFILHDYENNIIASIETHTDGIKPVETSFNQEFKDAILDSTGIYVNNASLCYMVLYMWRSGKVSTQALKGGITIPFDIFIPTDFPSI